MSGASGKLPPNGNGWAEREDTQTRIKLHRMHDETIAEARKKTTVLVLGLCGAVASLGTIGAVITFAVGRASSTDVQELDVRTVKLEQSTATLKEAVDKNEERAEQRHYRIEHKIDVALDQLTPMARRTGAPVLPRPPRAVMKPTVEITVEKATP